MGNAIVSVFGFAPIKSKFTPSFRCSKYKLGNAKQDTKSGKPFMEEKVFYDMLERNKLFFKPKKNASFDKPNYDETLDGVKMLMARLPIDVLADSDKSVIIEMLDKKLFDRAINILSKTAETREFEKYNIKPKIETIIRKITTLINLENAKNES